MLRRSIVSLFMVMTIGTLVQATPTTPPPLQGELTTLSGGLDGDGGWSDGQVLFGWTVTQKTDGSWNYQYVFDSSAVTGNLSHLILETSQNFMPGDIWNTTNGITLVGPELHIESPGNPDMPNPIFGIKFEDFSDNPVSILEFDSTRAPMWGSFYAKDGSPGGSLWNTGLDNGTAWVAVPDTYSSMIPAPGAIMLCSIGAGLVSWLRRRKHL